MSTDFSIKPVGAPAGQPANNAAVATELPAAQSVTAAGAGARAHSDADAAGVDVSRQAFLDRAAGAVVYQVVDARTHLVLQQFPDEAVLRRRAYFRALDQAGRAPARVVRTDRLA
jgi:hypothetical protein